MNRLCAAHLHLSPRLVQQGLFAVLVLLATLVAGQQFQRWSPTSSQVQSVPGHLMQQARQTHFSAIGASATDRAPYSLTSVDQAQVPDEPLPLRWVF